jgi:ABC-type transport system substrate-binding protein
MPGHSPGIGSPYDPQGARRLLAAAGYPDGRGFPEVEWLGIYRAENMLVCLQSQWRKTLGVDIPFEGVDGMTLFQRSITAPPHMYQSAWLADYPDPDNFLRVSTWPRRTCWHNEAYDSLVERARRVTDQTQRIKLYQQAERILIEEAPIMPFGYVRSPWLVKPWVGGFVPSPLFFSPLWKHVIIEPH